VGVTDVVISPNELYFLSRASADIGYLPAARVALVYARINGYCDSGLLSAGELPSADCEFDFSLGNGLINRSIAKSSR
jgi:hypothetical protein